jgi:hypothetical protein
MIDAETFNQARRDLVRSTALLMMPAMDDNTLAARNLTYHTEEMLKWLDAFYSGQDPAESDD